MDSFCFFLVYDERVILASVVAGEPLEGNRNFAICESLPLVSGAVLGNESGFFLSEASDDDQELSLALKRSDVFGKLFPSVFQGSA